MLIIENISPNIKKAIANDGFIIDYNNFDLVKQFTTELIKHLKKLKITYLTTNPTFFKNINLFFISINNNLATFS